MSLDAFIEALASSSILIISHSTTTCAKAVWENGKAASITSTERVSRRPYRLGNREPRGEKRARNPLAQRTHDVA